MPTLTEKRGALRARLALLPPPEDDPHPKVGGVLLSDEIAFYATSQQLVSPFDRRNLKPAAYELTVGDEYFLSGEFIALESNSNQKITIPPFEVAVLKTAEILRLPRYMIARWNIRVKHAYSGLLWVGGPQVDPGYVGHLFCPIYNLSDKPVTLHVGDPIAVIDFEKTTPYDKNKTEAELVRYQFPPKRLVLEEYGIDDLRSALFTRASVKLVEFEETINNLQNRFLTFTQISFAVFAMVIALVATLSKFNAEAIALSSSFWGALTVGISAAALLVSIFSYVSHRVGRLVYEQYGPLMGKTAEGARKFFRRWWMLGIGISMSLAFLGGLSFIYLTEPAYQELRQMHVLTKSDLDAANKSVSTHMDQISERLQRIERSRPATIDDLEKLKATIEQEIQKVRSEPR